VNPPEAQTAQPGDGAWTALGDPKKAERAAGPEPTVFRTLLHPHPQSRFVSVTLAAVDLCRLRLGYVPGKEDVPGVAFPAARGLVPEADQAALVAVFNGGYKPEHGKFGMLASGVSLVPPREGACTVGFSAAGVSISSQAPDNTLEAYRQTPACLLEAGALHPKLVAGDEKPWGGRAKDLVTRRRSAVGIDGSGRFLFYAVGEEAGPRLLGRALLAAGASAGAQLDINWYWTRFLLFGESGGRLAVTSTLLTGMEFQSTGYVSRPSERDFFYLVRRAPRPAP
jgi:hypothetical protein